MFLEQVSRFLRFTYRVDNTPQAPRQCLINQRKLKPRQRKKIYGMTNGSTSFRVLKPNCESKTKTIYGSCQTILRQNTFHIHECRLEMQQRKQEVDGLDG